MLLFACPDIDTPVGGIKKIYDHVALLCEAGLPASVLHTQQGFRCTWFESDATVAYSAQTLVSQEDVVVLPEIFAGQAKSITGGLPFAVFNQNAFFTFAGTGIPSRHAARESAAYLSPDSLGIVCVSEHNRQYLEHAFPTVDIQRVHYGMPQRETDSHGKKNLIAYMPRKNADHVEQVVNILTERGALYGFELVSIDGISHEAALTVLAEARVFLSFGYPEGCALPLLEAASSGCLTVGYDGYGGFVDSEVLNKSTGFPIAFGNTAGFATEVEMVLQALHEDPSAFCEKINAARSTVAANFSLNREKETVVAAWRHILKNHETWVARGLKTPDARIVSLPPDPRAAHEDRLTKEIVAIAHELKLRDDMVAAAGTRIRELDKELEAATGAIAVLEAENQELRLQLSTLGKQ